MIDVSTIRLDLIQGISDAGEIREVVQVPRPTRALRMFENFCIQGSTGPMRGASGDYLLDCEGARFIVPEGAFLLIYADAPKEEVPV